MDRAATDQRTHKGGGLPELAQHAVDGFLQRLEILPHSSSTQM